MADPINNDAVEALRREFNYDQSYFCQAYSDDNMPQLINSNFLNNMRNSHLVVIVKMAWSDTLIMDIFKHQLRFALSDNHLDRETIDKMAYSLYHYYPINTLHWCSLMTFFFHLGNGYIVQSRVSTTGQLIGALKIFLNEAKRREDECIRKIQAEENLIKTVEKENDNTCTWEELCQRRGYPPEWYDIRIAHRDLMQSQGIEINLELHNGRKNERTNETNHQGLS